MKKLGLLLTSIIVLPSLLALSQQPSASIEGVVVEEGTNTPLPKASLELRSMGSDQRYPNLSGDGGRFVIRGVTPGSYALIASHNGYMHAEYGQRGPNGNGLNIVLGAGERRTGIRLVLTRSGAISGHTFGPTGLPMAYVQVQALRLSYPSGQRTLTLTSAIVTDDLGAYRLYGLPPGQYVISAQTNPPNLGVMPVLASATPPVPGVVVFASAAGPMQYDQDPANSNKRLNDSSLTYFPSASEDRDARIIDVRPGDDVPGIDVTIGATPFNPVSVSGSVLGNEPANALITVVIMQLPSGAAQMRLGVRVGGTFNASLPPGSYMAEATTGRQNPTLMSAAYAVFDVRTGSVPPNLVLTLTPMPTVTGRVVVDGAPGVSDLTRARVGFQREPTAAAWVQTASSVAASADGSFATPGLLDGDWVVQFTGAAQTPQNNAGARGGPTASFVEARREPAVPTPPDNLRNAYVKSMRVSNAEIVNSRLRVPKQPAGPIELEVVVSLNGGQLSGVARTTEGEALSNVKVVLIPLQQERSELYKTLSTDMEGRFRFDAIPPGDYRLFSWEDVQTDDWRNPAFMTPIQDRGKDVHIEEGSRLALDAIVIRL